ncbi:unnamed protein product [Rotaria magnacalcarata]|uniref:mRNA-decapping enzyme 2 n=13 Tax=Rotaria magnacalcarata TaxID=392030 RepID=A0A819JMJ0_9BILA|nr:unnamed protein product [Rotaria magnacalcarata]CAF3931653.1 unnamed protein product [Rotaria magnacalcarata]
MASDQHQIPEKVLDDLCSRFIINIPAEQREDLVRVLFAVELAHWFYIDFYCEDDDDLYVCNIKEFAQQIFVHCPFLRNYVHNLDDFISRWRGYKLSVPTYGAVLLDPTYEHILLVKGFYNRESWGFPKGKVQENETPIKCAIREVMEEVGFDMKERAFEDQYLERDVNGQLIRLYIVKHVSLDTNFAPKTKNEIKDTRWFRIADLPCHRRDTTSQLKLNINPKAFFMVIPFIRVLRHWINQECGLNSSSNGDSDNANEYSKRHEHTSSHHHGGYHQPAPRRHRTMTCPNNTSQVNIQQKVFGVDQQTSSFIRDGTFEKRKNPSKIIADLTTQNTDEQQISPSNKLQKQLSVQDTIQRHFSQILKNDSITVTDNTTITETLLMRETNSAVVDTLNLTQLTPPMSNDDENKRPLSVKSHKGKRSTTQFRILPRDKPDELVLQMKTLESHNHDIDTPDKSQRNRRRVDRQLNHDIAEPLANLTNAPFRFAGPRCWTQFRLNRSEVPVSEPSFLPSTLFINIASYILGHSFPSIMIFIIISSFVIAILIVGLAIARYRIQRKNPANASTYSITRYWRRPWASTSCDNLATLSIPENKKSYPIHCETTGIIKNSFSWPETSMLHRQDQCASAKSSSALSYSLTMERIAEPASLTFGLRWDEITKSLFVRVVSARHLFIHRRHRQPLVIDSYVRLELTSTSTESNISKTFPLMRTHIVKKNAYPIYDELFQFINIEEINTNDYSLAFTISTYDTFTRDEVVGEIIFPLKSDTLDSTEMTFTHDLTTRHTQLNNQDLGQMLLSMCYQPADSNVTIIVLKASNLPRIGTTKLMNPYFKIYMFYKNQRIFKKRSTIKRTTQCPVYNECFTFKIPDNDIENIHFEIILFDYDNHMKHEAIGTCSIGKEMNQHWNDRKMLSSNLSQKLLKNLWNTIVLNKQFVRNGQRQPSILDEYANIYRPEVESELEYLAVQTSRNKSLQVDYEKEQQRKQRQTVRYHILRRKYVAHPNDIEVDPYIKNHMQFLHKNYPNRWAADRLAESFNYPVRDVKLILQQRTKRRMRVRPRPPSSVFGIKDDDEREKIIREHIIKRDLRNSKNEALEKDDGEPVDCQVLAEESNLVPRQRPSDAYMERYNDGFFSNIISSSDEDQQNKRDKLLKNKLLTSSPTLLDRITKLRLNANATYDTYSNDQSAELYNKRMEIIEKMQKSNDAILEMNEKKQKFLKKPPMKKIK